MGAATDVPAPIVVDVYASQPRPQELTVLIAACTRAAAPNECITSDVKSSEPPLGVAIVHRDGERARIELGLRGAASAEWVTRDLVFQAGDDELERYRAIGFAIGTLVARQVAPPTPPPSAPAAPAPASPPPAPRPAPSVKPAWERPKAVPERAALPPRRRSSWLDFSGGVGLGLIPGPPRAGAALRAATELLPRGPFGLAQVGFAERTAQPTFRARWLTLALGVGYPLTAPAEALGVDVRFQVTLEHLSLELLQASSSGSQSRWKPGLTVGADAHWTFAGPAALLVGADSFIDPERSVIKVGSEQVGETPALGLSGFLGLRLRLR